MTVEKFPLTKPERTFSHLRAELERLNGRDPALKLVLRHLDQHTDGKLLDVYRHVNSWGGEITEPNPDEDPDVIEALQAYDEAAAK
jgi:hypothetical protein